MTRKRLLLTLPMLVILLSSGFYGRQRYVHSPSYSLKQIQSAIEDKSRLRFEKFVDVEGVSAAFVGEILAKATLTSIKESDSGFGAIGSMLGAQMSEQLKPALAQEMRSTFLKAVETGRLDSLFRSARPDSTKADDNARKLDLMLLAENTASAETKFAGLGTIEREGDVATVGLLLRNELLDTTLTLRMRMEQKDGLWRITKPDNLSDYLDSIKELQEAVLVRENLKMRERITKTLAVGPLKRWTESVGWYSTYVYTTVTLTNTGTEPVDSILVWLEKNGTLLDDRAGAMVRTGPIAPGETVTAQGLFDYNQFMEDHRIARFTDGLEPRVIFASVDGGRRRRHLSEYESWSDYVSRRE